MFKSSSVSKDEDSAVLSERFYRNLRSNQSPFWLRRFSVYNKLPGVLSKEQLKETRVGKPSDLKFIPPSTRFTHSSLKLLFKRSNLFPSIVIVRNFLHKIVTSIVKNTGLHSIPFKLPNIIPIKETTVMNYSTRGSSLRPKIWRRLVWTLKITQNIKSIVAILKTALIFFPYLFLHLVPEMTSYLSENFRLLIMNGDAERLQTRCYIFWEINEAKIVPEVRFPNGTFGRSRSLIALKHSPSKDASLLDLSDIQKIQYLENRESQEDERDYDAGGYMPINIGDILKGQYKVCRKLGYGHFSTVWLCKNLVDESPSYVALKICKSAYMFAAVAQDEIKLLQETKTTDPTHPGYKYIVQMVDTFRLISGNGIHTAISMEIMGPSLLHILIQSDFRGINLRCAKKIIQQVLTGLTYLHDVCKIIHTDIKPENILIKIDQNYLRTIIGKTERFQELGVEMPRSYVTADCWSERERDLRGFDEDLLAKYEEQRGQSYPYDKYLIELSNFHKRHAEPRLSSPMWINPNIEIKIADLGNACWEDHHFSNEIQTRQYRALEVILGAEYSFPADLWSVGCMGFELATGEMLFNPKGDKGYSANLDHLCLIWETLGGIPHYITENGTNVQQFFSDGIFKNVPIETLRVWKIEDVLVDKYKWKRVDAIPFAGFLESLIEPDPALRFTATTALQSAWLTSDD